jgi:hypothetical protein
VVVLVVLTVSNVAPDPPVSVEVANWHEGGEVAFDGCEAIVHDRFTVPAKLFNEVTVTVEVAVPAGLTVAGFNAVAAMLKAACAYLATKASMPPA